MRCVARLHYDPAAFLLFACLLSPTSAVPHRLPLALLKAPRNATSETVSSTHLRKKIHGNASQANQAVPKRDPVEVPLQAQTHDWTRMRSYRYNLSLFKQTIHDVGDDPHGTGEAPEKGSDIWNKSSAWVTVDEWHPAGVISTINGGQVQWQTAGFLSFNYVLALTVIAYPASWIAIVLSLTVIVSLCLTTLKDHEHRYEGSSEIGEEHCQPRSPAPSLMVNGVMIPVLPKEHLSPWSQKVYSCWVAFCRGIPAMTVFGLPAMMAFYCYPRPQEVFSVVTVLTTSCMYTNTLYMAVFGWAALKTIQRKEAEVTALGQETDVFYREPQLEPELGRDLTPELRMEDVKHWVIMPQYKEDLEIVCMALESIAKNRLARTSISIVLAMEDREAEAREKVLHMEKRFSDSFAEIFATYHPPNLPNDPPGKASNTAWAFSRLVERLESKGPDFCSNVILTVSDADSEFHKEYFQELSRTYLREEPTERSERLWQCPVFHLKNYHRQPAPVAIGTMTTSFIEIGAMADPNAIRFPYSTYSLSMALARRVGGWDPQWIAEDWHMGIKCFLFTFGKARVSPIMLPILNYTPEEPGWLATIYSRWVQAKRHALGFSDMTYYFMTLPLIFGYVMSDGSRTCEEDTSVGDRIRTFVVLLMKGITMIIKIVNVHVLLGIASTYGMLTFVLHVIMQLSLREDRLIDYFFSRADFCPFMLFWAFLICTVVLTVVWLSIYDSVKDRIELDDGAEPSCIYKYRILHWLYIIGSVQIFGGLFFFALTLATWQAAIKVLLFQSFDYEVASKPTKETRLA